METYGGGTTINSGAKLKIGGAGQLGSGAYAGNIANSGTFDYNSSAAQNLSGIISGGGALTQDGAGTLTLSGVDTYTGNTTINAGSLVISGAGQLNSGSYAGNIANAGTFTYGSSAIQTLSGIISGTGALTQTGAGTLTLTGPNTYYTGSTTLNAGVVNAGIAESANVSGPFGKQLANAAGTIIFGGGFLQYSAANQFDYSGRFSTAANQPISIDTGGQTDPGPEQYLHRRDNHQRRHARALRQQLRECRDRQRHPATGGCRRADGRADLEQRRHAATARGCQHHFRPVEPVIAECGEHIHD